MKVYLAGPMTGLPDYNYPAFHAAARDLRARFPERTIINPAENHAGNQSLPRSEYFKVALPQVMSADALVLLPDWWTSEGAFLEVMAAKHLDIPLFTYEDGGTLLPLSSTMSLEYCVSEHDSDCGDEVDLTPADEDKVEAFLSSGVRSEDEDTESVLVEAERLVHGDRGAQYGHPSADFYATGRIAGAVLGRWFDNLGLNVVDLDGNYVEFPDVEPRIVAMMLIGVKLSREASSPKRDNRVDGAGYFLCMDEVVQGEGR